MVEVAAAEIPTPLTVALGAAAKQTGGRLVCVLPQADAEAARARLRGMGLLGAVEIVECSENASQVVERYEGVDFAAIDCKVVGDHVKLYKALKLNPKGSTVVAYNNLTDHLHDPNFLDVLKLAGKNNGVESYVTLPLVGEFGRLGFSGNTNTIASSSSRVLGSRDNSNNNNNESHRVCKGLNRVRTKKYRRFLVTFEN